MDTILRDIRYAFRVTTKTPVFAGLAVLILALGIGVNTAIFSLVNTLLLRPLNIQQPEQIVGLYSRSTERPDSYRGFSYPHYRDIRDRNEVFSELAIHDLAIVGLGDGDATRRSFVELISSNYFETFGVPLLQGRSFTSDEELPGSSIPAAVVSYGYWNKTGKDPDLLGKSVHVNGSAFTIVGIAARGFTGTMALLSPEVWLPFGAYELLGTDLGGRPRSLTDRAYTRLFVVGRLKPGVTQTEANSHLEVLAAQFESESPEEHQNQTLLVHTRSRLGLSTRPMDQSQVTMASAVLSAMAGIVLLIACLNLANMMLAKSTSRRKEIAIRLALGGSRLRLVRQLLSEGLLLSLVGGVFGLAIAYGGMRLLTSSLDAVIPFGIVLNTTPDARVLLAMLGFCVASTLLFGLGPAWKGSQPNVIPDLKENVGEAQGQRRRFSSRNLLVVGQLALSLVLLAAGGLFIRGAVEAARIDPGFDLDHTLLVELDPGLIGYEEPRARRLYVELQERLSALPGVETASVAATVPFGNMRQGRTVRRAGGANIDDDETTAVAASFNAVGANYFDTLDVPLLRGRAFTPNEAENASSAPVMVINKELADRLFPGEEPIGQTIEFAGRDTSSDERIFEVVGVTPTLQQNLIPARAEPFFFVPFSQEFRFGAHLHLRLSSARTGQSAEVLKAARAVVGTVDAGLPVLASRTFREHFDNSAEFWLVRTGARLFSIFGGLALFLAAAGVYGVNSFRVAQSTREIGIRMALGATKRDAVGLVLREGMYLTSWGIGLGLVLSIVAGQALSSMLYKVSATDPTVLIGTPAVLAAASFLACYVPARRAASVSTMTALRYE